VDADVYVRRLALLVVHAREKEDTNPAWKWRGPILVSALHKFVFVRRISASVFWAKKLENVTGRLH